MRLCMTVFLFIFTCAVEDLLLMIRPNSTYILHNGNYDGLEWTDKNTTKPTRQEMDQALIDCKAAVAQESSLREQAKTDLNTRAKTDTERIEAIIKYLSLDK